MNADELLRSALHARAAELDPTLRALPQVTRRPSPTVAIAGVGVVLLVGATAVAWQGQRSGPVLTAKPGTTAAGTPSPASSNAVKNQLDTESVTEHDGYLFHDKKVFGNVIDTSDSATRYGIDGTVVYYLTANTEGSPTPNLEFGIAETSTRRVLTNGGYGSDSTEATPGLHSALQGQDGDVVALLTGPGTVESNLGEAEVRPFDYADLSLVLAHGDVTSFHLVGSKDTVTVSG